MSRLRVTKFSLFVFVATGLALSAGTYLLVDRFGSEGAGKQFLFCYVTTAVLTFGVEWWRRRR
jgi:hypothetical protein